MAYHTAVGIGLATRKARTAAFFKTQDSLLTKPVHPYYPPGGPLQQGLMFGVEEQQPRPRWISTGGVYRKSHAFRMPVFGCIHGVKAPSICRECRHRAAIARRNAC